jgi:hypothetical protein
MPICECPIPSLGLKCDGCTNARMPISPYLPMKSYDVPTTRKELSKAREIMSRFFDMKDQELEDLGYEEVK